MLYLRCLSHEVYLIQSEFYLCPRTRTYTPLTSYFFRYMVGNLGVALFSSFLSSHPVSFPLSLRAHAIRVFAGSLALFFRRAGRSCYQLQVSTSFRSSICPSVRQSVLQLRPIQCSATLSPILMNQFT